MGKRSLIRPTAYTVVGPFTGRITEGAHSVSFLQTTRALADCTVDSATLSNFVAVNFSVFPNERLDQIKFTVPTGAAMLITEMRYVDDEG